MNQTPTEQQVSVVNLDPGKLSYELERWVDATPQVQIERRAFTIEEAKEQLHLTVDFVETHLNIYDRPKA